MKNTYKVQAIYTVTQTHEVSIDYNGYNFLIIYGHHANGWFIAMPNWNICTEAAHPTDEFYNTEKLTGVIDIPEAPAVLAKAVREHWEVCSSIK